VNLGGAWALVKLGRRNMHLSISLAAAACATAYAIAMILYARFAL
jgi:hypothetical protein